MTDSPFHPHLPSSLTRRTQAIDAVPSALAQLDAQYDEILGSLRRALPRIASALPPPPQTDATSGTTDDRPVV